MAEPNSSGPASTTGNTQDEASSSTVQIGSPPKRARVERVNVTEASSHCEKKESGGEKPYEVIDLTVSSSDDDDEQERQDIETDSVPSSPGSGPRSPSSCPQSPSRPARGGKVDDTTSCAFKILSPRKGKGTSIPLESSTVAEASQEEVSGLRDQF